MECLTHEHQRDSQFVYVYKCSILIVYVLEWKFVFNGGIKLTILACEALVSHNSLGHADITTFVRVS